MPRVLILSTTTGYQLRSFADAARELGVDLIFATDRCHSLDDPWRDSAVPVRFYEEDASLEAVAAAARGHSIDGLIAVGDRPVVLAARIAAALGLPGHPPDAARASANKRLARERFERAGLLVPWYVRASIDQPLEDVSPLVRYPAVIKPIGLSGSRGVIRVDDEGELETAFRRLAALLARPEIRAQRTGTERDLIVEGFIPGREYAIEGLLTNGRFQLLALFDKPDPLDGPFFEETIYVTRHPAADPFALSADAQMIDAVERAARALGLRHGPVHGECRVNGEGVYVLEVAARPIGGLCSRVLRFEDSGAQADTQESTARSVVSLEHLLLKHALGADVSGLVRERPAAAVMMIPIPRRGVFRGVRGEDAARELPYIEELRITAKSDQLLEPLPEAGSYLGFIFARAPQASQAEAAVRAAHRQLTFIIDAAIDVRPATPADARRHG